MTLTPRAAAALAVAALAALLIPPPLALLAAIAVLATATADALAVRHEPRVTRRVPHILARGTPAPLSIEVQDGGARSRVRQSLPPDLRLDPATADVRLDAQITPLRRGRHTLPPVSVRTRGPLGLGAWIHPRVGADAEVLVYPDLPSARRMALAVRRGRFREAGQLAGGPLGLGTDFERIREYVPDDDVRQVNWRATARLGRPMSNQYRMEQDRDVICVVDTGRLMAAPLGEATRLDAALDAAVAIAHVADVVGDRSGAVAFAGEVIRRLRPRRSGADAVVRALFDLEPVSVDSDYELAFRAIGEAKRAFVVVFTDLVEETAARPLIEAIPILARRHAVVVASVADPELTDAVQRAPRRSYDVYAAAVALDVLEQRRRAVSRLRAAGAEVVEAPPHAFGAACVTAYLRAKVRARV